jgi:hypothetical protein
MRFCLALLVVVAFAGCPGAGQPINGQVMYTDAGCRVGCDKCPVNTFCVSAPYDNVCVQHCFTTSDCLPGQKCALLNLPGLYSTGCVTGARPSYCSPEPCNIQRKCKDSKTLLIPLDYSDLVCGWEVVPCPNGCDLTASQCK